MLKEIRSKPSHVRHRIVIGIVVVVGFLLILWWVSLIRTNYGLSEFEREQAYEPFRNLGSDIQTGYEITTSGTEDSQLETVPEDPFVPYIEQEPETPELPPVPEEN